MTKSRGIRRHWTEKETVLARELYKTLGTYSAVAKAMGWSATAVRDQATGRTGSGWGHSHSQSTGDPAAIHVPQAVWDMRDRLAELPHADLTAILMGDPPVGRRALVNGG